MTGNQTASSMFDFNSFICMVRIRTFFGRFGLKTLGPTVALSFFAIAQVAQDLVILYMTFCWDIDPPCIFLAMIDCWAWIHLVHLWPWLLFDMAPFCILSDHYSFISYTYVGSTYIYGDVLYMDMYVPEISFSDIYLSFRYLHSSLSILYFSALSPYSAFSFIMYFGYRLPL